MLGHARGKVQLTEKRPGVLLRPKRPGKDRLEGADKDDMEQEGFPMK